MIKYLKKISENKYFKFFTNLYVITSLLFLFWMIFMDTNSLIFHKELNNEIRDLTEQRNKLKIEIEKDKKLINDLMIRIGRFCTLSNSRFLPSKFTLNWPP